MFIAGAQIWPQVTSLRQKVKSLGLNNLRVEKLDLLHPYDVAHALMCESALHWQDDSRNFIKRADIENYFAFFGEEEERHDPKEVIEAMVSIVPADTGFFRNVVPKAFEEFIKTDQKEAWENNI